MMIKESSPVKKSTQRARTKSKILVLFLMVLIMSSGSVIYIDTPIFYYGILGVGVLLILFLVFMVVYLTQEPEGLFTDKTEDLKVIDNNKGPSPGLEKVFEAEQNFKNKKRKKNNLKVQIQSKAKDKKQLTAMCRGGEDRELKRKKGDSANNSRSKLDKDYKKNRIGSISLEETFGTEKFLFENKNEKEPKAKGDKKVTTFLCPSCGSKELYYEAGLISGYKYHCKDCDYIGSFVIEKDFNVKS